MRKLLFLFVVLTVLFCFFNLAFGQVTKIKDIQFTVDPSGDSPLKDQVVTISGIITGEPYAFGSYYFVQDSAAAWCGMYVYDYGRKVAQGDSVTLTGTVAEYNGLTEITTVTSFTINDSAGVMMPPTVVTTGEIATDSSMAEAYESVLVQVQNVVITNPSLGYGEWEVNDGSGPCRVDDAADYYFDPADFDSARSITGLLVWNYGDTKILPRLANDIIQTGEFTRLQRIQQVRQSDLLKAPVDGVSDFSYMSGDTMTVTGVVTMPTGLSYAGNGIKFIFGDPKGGPWSGILSYHADSTAYPSLFEGDIIKMTGYIGEYTTGQSNMTEFWMTSPIDILNFGQPPPPVDTVKTGDLRLPVTAEQWGTVMIAVKNAVVKNLAPTPYELFSIDDGTGEVLVDDDSDSMSATIFPDPPQGTILESVRGWVYHHYGSYADSTTYVLEPLYSSDIVVGLAPPSITYTGRSPGVPTASDPVAVSATVVSNLTLTNVDILYRVDGGDYQVVPMTDGGGGAYAGNIPAQAEGSFVDYYIYAKDNSNQESVEPFDIVQKNFCYPVTDGNLAISDLQYTPWELQDTPFEGVKVSVTGIVTSDTAMNNNFAAYSIQDGTGPWAGIYIFGTLEELTPGDQVTVHGTATDYNPDWLFKWGNNTLIVLDSLNVTATGQTIPAANVLSTGDLSGSSATAEGYESSVVKVQNVTLSSINQYDFTVDDGSGGCLVDDDALPSGMAVIPQFGDHIVLYGDTVRVGDIVDSFEGIFTFSFGTYKISLRNKADIGTITGVNEDVPIYPLTYNLEQNFPNPFNPETRLYFSVPVTDNVKIVIYNSIGQIVRILVDATYQPGRHVVNWDGRNQDNQLMPTGMYFYRMKSGDHIFINKMMLLK